MDRSVKAPSMPGGENAQYGAALGLAVGVPSLIELAGAAVWSAPMYGGPAQDVPLKNPVALGWHLMATHDIAWTGEATAALGTLVGGGLATVAATAIGVRWACRKCAAARAERRWRKGRPAHVALGKGMGKADRHPIDERAKFMGRGSELDDLRWEAVEAKAAKLGVQLGEGQVPGVLIGSTVADGHELWGSFEDLHLDIWGPRQGKSTSRVIPAIMDAPGAVVATSNKRDVVDATRGYRATRGDVWVFDPQGVAKESPRWYWDPCEWVRGDGGPEAQERAQDLAGHFADFTDSTSSDAFFEPEGEDLLAGLILAAALAKRPITQVFAWVTMQSDNEPIGVVSEHGFTLVAAALANQYNAAPKQRDGVFATAKKMCAVLKNESIRQWVCPPTQGERPRQAFDVDAFARSTDSLYLLSKDKKSSAGPLVTALAAAVTDAGDREGTLHPGGRLPVPMLIVLDEAANIVRWRELPKLYSHFGSRGLIVMTILQSWAQGVGCWGEAGMKALWSAANIKVLGSGLDDEDFLQARSRIVGDHRELVTSVSRGRRADSGTESTSLTTETTLTASDIAAMPRGRALVFTAGHRPTLVRTTPWMERGDADLIRDSIEQFEPKPTSVTGPHLRAVPSSEEDAA
ncbi:type IV secretory system conjugative DNA transfer family protein [Nocardia nova]|uniref:type IV secretory system conjugative DNA transfer family protein n=1 Tax=Nocardia nova TaxID=37330 RepID=UPI001FD3C1B8|nr:TraM recognition domain-containing protein [Nocardia nova]